GTMAGLYETAIDALCARELDGRRVGPKIVASTATVRRAEDQIQALFGRPLTRIFPPPGPDRRDTFFARAAPASEKPARLYVGVAAQGRSPKVMMRKAWLALMGAAQRAYLDAGDDANRNNPADPYMTVPGYFNNLRELGGAWRILEEEVQSTIKGYGERRRVGEARGLFANRERFSEVRELTSRVKTNEVAETRRRLEAPFYRLDDRVDCALATNMISVGLDIPRLGLMVVIGQPMLTAEYIQATSRVGHDEQRPGLVVTLLNFHKPRDRSHYERFRHYHETFYRAVEAASVTPFAARALDRGFAGALVALARHLEPDLSAPDGVAQLARVRPRLERQLIDIFQARVQQQDFDADEREERLLAVQNRVVDLLDAWQRIVSEYREAGATVQYQPYEGSRNAKWLLRDPLEKDFDSDEQRKFRAGRSLRDVEPEVNLYLRDLNNRLVEE
ncbi:MAG: helicase-related protein, partial [Chloroflexaceae bacterium]